MGTRVRRDRVLIVQGEKESCGVLRNYIADQGYEVGTAGTCELAEQVCRATRPDLAILDFSLPDGNALRLIPKLKAMDATIPIIILTGYGSIDLAVDAVKAGAEYFLPKPADLAALHALVQRCLENQRNHRQQSAEKNMGSRIALDPFLGTSDRIRVLSDLAERLAFSDTPVLIQGEAGTGKAAMAQWLHKNGSRASEPFVNLNCGGASADFVEAELFGDDQGETPGTSRVKAGLLELAHKGTVFLERIEDLDFQNQLKLLRVVEEKQVRRRGDLCDRRVDIRLIATTRQVMAQPALRKHFRGDASYRIRWSTLSVPPLRERPEDIPVLSAHILAEMAADLGIGSVQLGAVAVRALQAYSWPGNIRELKNVLERVALLAGSESWTDNDLHFDVQVEQYLAGIGQFRTLEEMERTYIQQVLHKERGRVQSAARKLGIPRSSLYHKLKQYKTDQPGMRPVS
jgi:DNA-binding NtrC family response regulator